MPQGTIHFNVSPQGLAFSIRSKRRLGKTPNQKSMTIKFGFPFMVCVLPNSYCVRRYLVGSKAIPPINYGQVEQISSPDAPAEVIDNGSSVFFLGL
jgi:hypothetical protein